MKTKTVLLIAIASLLVGIFVGGFFGRSKGPDPDYWISRDEYNQTVKDMEAGLQESLRLIAERDKTIRWSNPLPWCGYSHPSYHSMNPLETSSNRRRLKSIQLRGPDRSLIRHQVTCDIST